MKTIRYFLALSFLFLSYQVYSAKLPDDIEPGDSINEIELPLTKQSAAELIRIESHGKVLSVDKKPHKGKFIFRVKVLLDNGTVKFYKLDPDTGHVPN